MKFLEAIELLSTVGFKQPHIVIIIYLLQGELKLSGGFSFSNYVCIMKEWIWCRCNDKEGLLRGCLGWQIVLLFSCYFWKLISFYCCIAHVLLSHPFSDWRSCWWTRWWHEAACSWWNWIWLWSASSYQLLWALFSLPLWNSPYSLSWLLYNLVISVRCWYWWWRAYS